MSTCLGCTHYNVEMCNATEDGSRPTRNEFGMCPLFESTYESMARLAKERVKQQRICPVVVEPKKRSEAQKETPGQ